MSTCFPIPQYWSDTTAEDVNMNRSSVRADTGGLPPISLFRQNTGAPLCEGLSPVTDMANHTGLWLEKNETEIAIKGIHVRNGFKPCYLLPRQPMETHLLLCLTIDKNNARPRTVFVRKSEKHWMQHDITYEYFPFWKQPCFWKAKSK